jgi:hypothetical protein
MNSKIFWQALGAIILVFAAIFALNSFTAKAPATDAVLEASQMVQVSLSVQGLYDSKSVSVADGGSVLDVLKTVNSSDSSLALKTKEYSGLGTLVESMGGMTNGGDKKYWQYFVNGSMPQVGADKYQLKGGEKIEWKFEASQY